MYSNPFVHQLLVEERREDAMRHSEQARLIQVVEGSKKSWRWRWPMTLTRQRFLLSFYDRRINNLESVR